MKPPAGNMRVPVGGGFSGWQTNSSIIHLIYATRVLHHITFFANCSLYLALSWFLCLAELSPEDRSGRGFHWFDGFFLAKDHPVLLSAGIGLICR